MPEDTEETVWVADDLYDVEVTLNPPPFIAARAAPIAEEVPQSTPVIVPQWAAQQDEAGKGLYVAFDDDGNGAVVCVQNSIAHLLDGFRVR